MQVILFDTQQTRNTLFPFTTTRPVADILTGILTNRERWQVKLHTRVTVLTEDYLQEFPDESGVAKLYVHAALFPSLELFNAIKQLKSGEGILYRGEVIAVCTIEQLQYGFGLSDCNKVVFREWESDALLLTYPFEIMQWNDRFIKEDYRSITKDRFSQNISPTNRVTSPENIFIEAGASVEHCIINASSGPVYIGKDALVMEGAMIRGPFAMRDGCVVKMGAKIYGATTAGSRCTIGGEIKNTVFFDCANKAHDGYVGDAVIGAWCNLGAGTSCSNIRNNAGEIKIWNPLLHKWIHAGTKCGVLMGDYSRTAVNTSLNTGTVTGVCTNIVCEGFPPKYIKSFTWNIATREKYVAGSVIRDIQNWMQLKRREITGKETAIIEHLYQNEL